MLPQLEQLLIQQAIAIVEASIKRGEKIRFVGDLQLDLSKRELVPNESNPALMDVAKVNYYSGAFEIWTGKKKSRKQLRRFYVGQDIERLEIGIYWDTR